MATRRLNSDVTLILGIKKDRHDSFEQLFSLYSKPLYRFAYGYLKSKETAEDVVQEVFLRIWHNRRMLRTDTSFKSYIFTIALNAIRKHFNQLSNHHKVMHDILSDVLAKKEDLDDRSDFFPLLNKLDDLIRQMPDKRRQVFIRKKIEGKSLKEISDELAITSKTVEYHITEAMKFLIHEFAKLSSKGIILFNFLFRRKKS